MVCVERALPCLEHIGSSATQRLSNEIATMTQAADNLLDRQAVGGELRDCRICIFRPQIALVPQLFCRGEQLWGDCRRTDRAADCAHGLAHRVEEGRAGVLYQVPTIGDLNRIGQRLGNRLTITATAIA